MSLRVSTSRPDELGLLGAHVQRRADELGEAGVERLARSGSGPVALAMPKSITLGTGTPSMSVTRMFDGLRSRWMIPFWWACCTAWQTRTNSSSRSADRELLAVAVVGDRDAADQLHDEVGPARLGGAGVEHPGDVRVVHQRQGLPLGLEPGDHLPGVHARLDDLQGHLAADRAASARPCRRCPCPPRRSAPAACRGRSIAPGRSAAAGMVDRRVAGRGRRGSSPPARRPASSRSTRSPQGRVAPADLLEVGGPRLAVRDPPGHVEDRLFVELHRRSSTGLPAGSSVALYRPMRNRRAIDPTRPARILEDVSRRARPPRRRAWPAGASSWRKPSRCRPLRRRCRAPRRPARRSARRSSGA